jgi:dTDP-4-dehydrorhamnose 3,5-epimerase
MGISQRKDAPVPRHNPEFDSSGIDGVVLMKSPTVKYLGDNLLTELYRPEWHGVFKGDEPIEHLYTVKASSGGTRTEWYYHEHTLDRYMILSGTLDMGLYDGRKESPSFGLFEVLTLGEPGGDLPNSLRIPPLVWHSLRWKSPSGMFMVAKLPGFQPDGPDKVRIQLEDLPDAINWTV